MVKKGESVTALSEAFQQFENRLQTWGSDRDDVRAMIIIGSRARTEHPADEWSDMDVLLFINDPAVYVQQADWLDALGEVWLTFVEPTATGDQMERRALFAGGIDVDFVPLPAAFMQVEGWPPGAFTVFQRGYRFLVDKEGLADTLPSYMPPPAAPASSLPDLSNSVADFWYHTVWIAKKLRRGELATALGCLNSYMMGRCLLPLIESHARKVYGAEHNVWFNGRFLEKWADPRTVERLRGVFSQYDTVDAWRALDAQMDLVSWMTNELGITNVSAAQIRAYVAQLQAEKDSTP